MRVLSLGGGQQSTAVYLLAATGKIPPIDYAIFADTSEEPKWVYETVQELGRFPGGAPVLVRGKPIGLGDTLISRLSKRFPTLPWFIKHLDQYTKGKPAQGKGQRQCTREFKIEVVERTIRRELLGLKPGQAYRGPRVTQVFGFDSDEGGRIVDVQARLAEGKLSVGDFPLWDRRWTRLMCAEYNVRILHHEVLSSACVFCPLVSNRFRRLLRDRDPDGWKRACEVDAAIRMPENRASQTLSGKPYFHRSMKPLSEANIDEDEGLIDFGPGCEGYCGH